MVTVRVAAIATAAANAVLQEMHRIDAPHLARERGEELVGKLQTVPGVASVRGVGLLLAAELAEGIDAKAVYASALEFGLVTNAVTPTALRLAPPITVSSAEIDEAVAILALAIQEHLPA